MLRDRRPSRQRLLGAWPEDMMTECITEIEPRIPARCSPTLQKGLSESHSKIAPGLFEWSTGTMCKGRCASSFPRMVTREGTGEPHGPPVRRVHSAIRNTRVTGKRIMGLSKQRPRPGRYTACKFQ